MKKIIIITTFLCLTIFSSFAFAAYKTLDGKIGSGYATDPEKFGWQLNFAYLTELDPFFALGFEPGIYWIEWERKVGKEDQGVYRADVKADTNTYTIPVLVDAQIRLPNLEKKLYVKPYITLGIGYSIMIFTYTQPEYIDSNTGATTPSEDKTKFYHGLTWQFMGGVTLDPGPTSKVEFLAEIGYRGSKLKKGDLEVNMSGLIINLGIRYPFSVASPATAI